MGRSPRAQVESEAKRRKLNPVEASDALSEADTPAAVDTPEISPRKEVRNSISDCKVFEATPKAEVSEAEATPMEVDTVEPETQPEAEVESKPEVEETQPEAVEAESKPEETQVDESAEPALVEETQPVAEAESTPEETQVEEPVETTEAESTPAEVEVETIQESAEESVEPVAEASEEVVENEDCPMPMRPMVLESETPEVVEAAVESANAEKTEE